MKKGGFASKLSKISRTPTLDDDVELHQRAGPSTGKKMNRFRRIQKQAQSSDDEEYLPTAPACHSTRQAILSESDEESEIPIQGGKWKNVVIPSSSEGEATPRQDSNSPMDADNEAGEFDRDFNKLLRDGYTEQQAYIVLAERSKPRPSQMRPVEKNQEGYFTALMENGFKGTLYPHVPTLQAMGIDEDVDLILGITGLSKLATMVCPCYKLETAQFLSTVEVKLLRNPTKEQIVEHGGGYIRFHIYGEEYEVTLQQVQELYGFAPGAPTKINTPEGELDEVWYMLSGTRPFVTSRSKGNRVRNPALNVARRVIGGLLYARPSPGPINTGEMQQLDIALATITGQTATGVELVGDTGCAGLAYVLAKQFTAYRSRAMSQLGRENRKAISIGGVVTPLLASCGVPFNLDEENVVAPRFLDIAKLKSYEVLHFSTSETRLAYNLYQPLKKDAIIQLPCRQLTSLSSIENIVFAHPLDRFRRAEEEEVAHADNPEQYYFDEYVHPKMGVPTREAHKRVNKLQKLGKWLVESFKGLRKERSEWKKEKEELKKEMAEIRSKINEPARHSVSIGRAEPPLHSEPSQARHSSAEIQGRRMNRKKQPVKMKYGPSYMRDIPDDIGESSGAAMPTETIVNEPTAPAPSDEYKLEVVLSDDSIWNI